WRMDNYAPDEATAAKDATTVRQSRYYLKDDLSFSEAVPAGKDTASDFAATALEAPATAKPESARLYSKGYRDSLAELKNNLAGFEDSAGTDLGFGSVRERVEQNGNGEPSAEAADGQPLTSNQEAFSGHYQSSGNQRQWSDRNRPEGWMYSADESSQSGAELSMPETMHGNSNSVRYSVETLDETVTESESRKPESVVLGDVIVDEVTEGMALDLSAPAKTAERVQRAIENLVDDSESMDSPARPSDDYGVALGESDAEEEQQIARDNSQPTFGFAAKSIDNRTSNRADVEFSEVQGLNDLGMGGMGGGGGGQTTPNMGNMDARMMGSGGFASGTPSSQSGNGAQAPGSTSLYDEAPVSEDQTTALEYAQQQSQQDSKGDSDRDFPASLSLAVPAPTVDRLSSSLEGREKQIAQKEKQEELTESDEVTHLWSALPKRRGESRGREVDSKGIVVNEELARPGEPAGSNKNAPVQLGKKLSKLPMFDAYAAPSDSDGDGIADTPEVAESPADSAGYGEQYKFGVAISNGRSEQDQAERWKDLTRRRKKYAVVNFAGLEETNAADEAFSTFSLHVSDVSFKLTRAALARGEWPDPEKIRIEEFVNAFDYGDPIPSQDEKVACRLEQSIHPFLQQRNVLRVSMRTAAAGRASSTPLRLTLLLDNSGSMERIDRQQTVRRAFTLLAEQLTPADQVTLISFARQPRLLADRVSGAQSKQLVDLIQNLPSEGGTNIEAALQLAFEKAQEQKVEGAQNRVILLTDGAVNLGDANPESLSNMITTMRNADIAFDAAGISAEGLNDEVLEALTRKGDGRYYMLDSVDDADDGFARQIAGALRPSAKNVKVQIEFNPKRVGRYKLLGFEKHRLNKEDFSNDKVDAAEMAAAEAGVAVYQFEAKPDGEGDIGSVSVRFQDLSTGRMTERCWPIPYEADAPRPDQAAPSLKIATSAAFLAAKLRGEPLGESVDLKALSSLISGLPNNTSSDRVGELQSMIEQARQLTGN
ncbi:MAG: von Willebrand factor type A domain-containing protein, partial [Planctomycetales bacterium]|nr:von Willebrand factor type A domain-containing protein [Planctomycetales bacterium]